jgi:sortase A
MTQLAGIEPAKCEASTGGVPRRRPASPMRRLARLTALIAVVVGLCLIGEVAWQLWGTGIATARAQHRLGAQFAQAVSTGNATAVKQADAADIVPSTRKTIPPLGLGGVVGHLVIPRIGVNDYVVEGTGSAQLAEGPGHYVGTAPIGGAGNVGIAGHRTTHGAPFYNLNELQPGDLIYLTDTAGQTYTYRVAKQFVVAPSDGSVLDPTPTATLTLTTCNPRYWATQRLIVQASLVIPA